MTSQEKDKFICEKLGVEWHEQLLADGTCACGYKHWCVNASALNPDFSSEAGRVQLLRLMNEQDKIWSFFTEYPERQNGLFGHLLTYMLNDTGKFRDAVFEWLGGEE